MRAPAPQPSSTSSSDRAVLRDVIVTLVWIAVVVLVAELAFRAVVPQLSANSRSIAASAGRAAEMAAYDGPTVLILGNSISGEGIDPDLLNEALHDAGSPARIWHQPADTTAMRDWTFELQNLFVARGATPDVLVLPVGFERPLVRVNARTEDLYQSFLGPGDLRVLFELDGVDGLEDRTGARLSRMSALYGFRGRVQKRILVALVPGYEDMWGAIRRSAEQEAELVTNDAWVQRMHDMTQELGIDVIVVAMPSVALEGRLPAGDRELADRFGWTVLEPAADVTFDETERPDGFHLTEPARERFTTLLAPSLVARLAELTEGS